MIIVNLPMPLAAETVKLYLVSLMGAFEILLIVVVVGVVIAKVVVF